MCKIGEFTPYKGYEGTIEYSYSDNLYYGSLKNTENSITYHATNVVKLHERFKEVVDDYIEIKSSIYK